MVQIKLRDDYIKLGQALKVAGLVETGSEAKSEIWEQKVKVNGQIETQRGKKLHEGDIIEYEGQQIKIIK